MNQNVSKEEMLHIMKQKKWMISIVTLLVIVAGCTFVGAYRKIRQQTLDHALILAIKAGDDKKAIAVLAEGANGETRETNEPPSLKEALLDLIRHSGHRDVPSLDRTVSADHLPALLLLYHQYYWVNRRDESGPNPVLVRQLLKHGAQATDLDEFDTSSLWYASCFSNSETVNLLVNGGADVDSNSLNGQYLRQNG
jgi:hypothetical protein